MTCECRRCRPWCQREAIAKRRLRHVATAALCRRCDRALHVIDGQPVEPPSRQRRRERRAAA